MIAMGWTISTSLDPWFVVLLSFFLVLAGGEIRAKEITFEQERGREVDSKGGLVIGTGRDRSVFSNPASRTRRARVPRTRPPSANVEIVRLRRVKPHRRKHSANT
jgi:hypothetical protein